MQLGRTWRKTCAIASSRLSGQLPRAWRRRDTSLAELLARRPAAIEAALLLSIGWRAHQPRLASTAFEGGSPLFRITVFVAGRRVARRGRLLVLVVFEDVVVEAEVARASRSGPIVGEAASQLSVDRRCLCLIHPLGRRLRGGAGLCPTGLVRELSCRAGVNLRDLSWPLDSRITRVILLDLPRSELSGRPPRLLARDIVFAQVCTWPPRLSCERVLLAWLSVLGAGRRETRRSTEGISELIPTP